MKNSQKTAQSISSADRPAGAKPIVAKPTVAKPTGAKPAGAKPADAKPAGAKPFIKPAHWSNDPVPQRQAAPQDTPQDTLQDTRHPALQTAFQAKPQNRDQAAADDAQTEPLSPTRYGDWVRNGIAVDF